MFCSELGRGLGPMMRMAPLASDLAAEGHNVYFALPDLLAFTCWDFERAGVRILQAPRWTRVDCGRPLTYAQMLLELGYENHNHLFAIATCWRNMLEMPAVDLVVCDGSPTALLASRGLPCRRALIGSGFGCPPPVEGPSPWGVLRPGPASRALPRALRDSEWRLLDRINVMLPQWGEPPIEHPDQLFTEVDENFLTTLPELDPFAARRGAGYWGPVLVGDALGGAAPRWPDAPGRRIFAWLRRGPALLETLQALRESRQPTVAYVEGLDPAVRRGLRSPTLRLSSRPPDLSRAARECEVGVVSGGHGATAELLLAGRPLLQLPVTIGQRATADAAIRLGAATATRTRWRGGVRPALEGLIHGGGGERQAACAFAARYADFDPVRQRRNLLARARELLAR